LADGEEQGLAIAVQTFWRLPLIKLQTWVTR
jgi:hypothetical protein